MAINDFIRVILPAFSTPAYTGSVDIIEQDNNASVKRVTWVNSTFCHLNHTMAKTMKIFFEEAHSPDIFRKDCDGIILFEHEGKKYMFLTELKSKFDSAQLLKAKKQLISTFIKANMLFNLSSCYKIEDYIIKGFIISHPPTSDFRVNLSKASYLSSIPADYALAKRLFLNGNNKKFDDEIHKTIMRPVDCECLHELPFGNRGIFQQIELHHISVPNEKDSITLDVQDFI